MKKHFYLLVVFLITLLLCSGSATRKRPTRIHKVTYCQLNAKPLLYHEKMIRVRAVLYSTPGLLTSSHCDTATTEETLLAYGSSFRASPELQKWLAELQNFKTERNFKMAEVQVVGKFDAKWTLGCFAPRYRLIVEKLEPESDAFDQ